MDVCPTFLKSPSFIADDRISQADTISQGWGILLKKFQSEKEFDFSGLVCMP